MPLYAAIRFSKVRKKLYVIVNPSLCHAHLARRYAEKELGLAVN
jgi:hypothetical protein